MVLSFHLLYITKNINKLLDFPSELLSDEVVRHADLLKALRTYGITEKNI